MKQIKNNYKFSDEKNYNKEFLCELENKEEFDCTVNTDPNNHISNGQMSGPNNTVVNVFRRLLGRVERNGNNGGY